MAPDLQRFSGNDVLFVSFVFVLFFDAMDDSQALHMLSTCSVT